MTYRATIRSEARRSGATPSIASDLSPCGRLSVSRGRPGPRPRPGARASSAAPGTPAIAQLVEAADRAPADPVAAVEVLGQLGIDEGERAPRVHQLGEDNEAVLGCRRPPRSESSEEILVAVAQRVEVPGARDQHARIADEPGVATNDSAPGRGRALQAQRRLRLSRDGSGVTHTPWPSGPKPAQARRVLQAVAQLATSSRAR